MKRTILAFAASLALSGLNAQIEIQQDTLGPNVAGTIIDVNVDQFTPTPYYTKFYVTNNSGSDKSMYITRIKQSVPSTWIDYVCWPPQCYPAGSGDVYSTPSSQGNPPPVIVNGTHRTPDGALAELGSQVYSDGNNAVAFYMYYVTDVNGIYLDSVGVRINFVLDVEEKTEPKVSVAPNPANSYINVQTKGAEGGTITVLDVLGNIVLAEQLTSASKTINTENFRNGVYFIRIEGDGFKTSNRKIIIRH